jgi:hypothetical protein
MPIGSLARIVDPQLGQALATLLEVTNLHQCRPQLDRALDDVHNVSHDPQQIVLKEVRLEAVEGLVQVGGENPKRRGASCALIAPS